MPDEDFEAARKAYEWPRRFGDVLREAGSKAAAEHREFEGALKKRRREFAERVEEYTKEVAVVEGRGEVIRREQIVAEVTVLALHNRMDRTYGFPIEFSSRMVPASYILGYAPT